MPQASPFSDPPAVLEDRIAVTHLDLADNVERLSGPEREIPNEVASEHLLARLQSMPVIEQAKGILMAQSRCTPDQAFAMIRAASQRSNVKVRDIAGEIVARVSGAEQKCPLPQSSPDKASPGG